MHRVSATQHETQAPAAPNRRAAGLRGFGLRAVRSACSTPAGSITRAAAAFAVEPSGARLITWRPGQTIPKLPPTFAVVGGIETTAGALAALGAHADVWQRATRNGEPTIDNPRGASWRDRRAA